MDNTIKNIVAKNLIELRKSRNLTQSELAEMLNYSDKTISKWENGDSLPDISVLAALVVQVSLSARFTMRKRSPFASAAVTVMPAAATSAAVGRLATSASATASWATPPGTLSPPRPANRITSSRCDPRQK